MKRLALLAALVALAVGATLTGGSSTARAFCQGPVKTLSSKPGQTITKAACGGSITCNFDVWVGYGQTTVCSNFYPWTHLVYGSYWDAAPGCYGGAGAVVGFSPNGNGDRRCGPVGSITVNANQPLTNSVYVANLTGTGGTTFPIHFYGYAST